MSDGSGADSRASTWDNPSWSSSLSDSSLSGRPEEQPPNPWSRQAAQPGADPGPASVPSAPPAAAPEPAAFEPGQPGFDPQPPPPYGGVNPYGSNPYETNPYQPAYGAVSPYGVAPPSHPQASTAMIFGILGVVFAFSCGIGGLIGIPGIVIGRRVRNEIDAQPGRYAGRSQAVAGVVTGIIGVVLAVVVTAVIALAIAAGIAADQY